MALWLTLISSNYPCLEHIFMVPRVFEPLKFDCIYKSNRFHSTGSNIPGKRNDVDMLVHEGKLFIICRLIIDCCRSFLYAFEFRFFSNVYNFLRYKYKWWFGSYKPYHVLVVSCAWISNTVKSRYLKVGIHSKLHIFQSKFSGPWKFSLCYQLFEITWVEIIKLGKCSNYSLWYKRYFELFVNLRKNLWRDLPMFKKYFLKLFLWW